MRGGQDVYIINVIAKANAEIPPAIVGRAKRIVKLRTFAIYELIPENDGEMKATVLMLSTLKYQGKIIAYRVEQYHKGEGRS